MQQNNPFMVTPANYDTKPVMSGVNQVLDTTRVLNKKKRMKEAMTAAFESGDPRAVANFVAEYPEAQQGLSTAMGFKSDATKRNYLDTLRGVLTTGQENLPIEERNARIKDMLIKRNEFVKAQGGTPSDTEKGVEDFVADPDGFLQRAELGYAAMAPAEELSQYNLQRGVSPNNRMNFSGKDVFKDDEGNYFSSTNVNDPATGAVTPVVKAMDGSDIQPVGQLKRVSTIGLTPEEIVKHEGSKTQLQAKVRRHEKAVDDLTKQLGGFNEEARLLDEAEQLLQTGNVTTGTIANMFPSFEEETIRLQNIGQKLGLNIIQNTTFGALSEAEMNLAMQTGFPTNLQPEALLQWTRDRRAARAKLKNEIVSAIRFMNAQDPNDPEYANAQANWQAQREAEANAQAEAQQAPAQAQGGAPQMSDEQYQQELQNALRQ